MTGEGLEQRGCLARQGLVGEREEPVGLNTCARLHCLPAQGISRHPSLRAWGVCHLEFHSSLHMRSNGGMGGALCVLLLESLLGLWSLFLAL